jgi:gamma-glutamyl:cysteine ligase YbdK (ATP-grasp superfamily)
MGQEIADSRFTDEHFAEFRRRLARETALLGEWIAAGTLRSDEPVGGFELEAWLIDEHGHPAPVNEPFLKDLGDPLVVPELSTFNVELNTPPRRLDAGTLDVMHRDLASLWHQCEASAMRLGAHMVMIGILPTVQQSDLTLRNMSSMQRYRALNEQVFRLRSGRPIELDIAGHEAMRLEHRDVMLEAATTSFQIHLMVDTPLAVRAFNASKMLSAPMVALAANSPFLFGKDLWEETRIPLFEQAVAVGGSNYSKRVTFGVRYARESIMECFEANRDRYPVLLPTLLDEPAERLAHLRLHNGTIWRWNRPLVGFSADGRPHLRIEHRVAPSGPTVSDAIANAAFFFGALTALAHDAEPPERHVSFDDARRNFYAAARLGLQAQVRWDGARGPLRELCLQRLLPLAQRGLDLLGCSAEEAERWLGVLRGRIDSGRTGAAWQRAWVAANGRDFDGLVRSYREQQQQDRPVHTWET